MQTSLMCCRATNTNDSKQSRQKTSQQARGAGCHNIHKAHTGGGTGRQEEDKVWESKREIFKKGMEEEEEVKGEGWGVPRRGSTVKEDKALLLLLGYTGMSRRSLFPSLTHTNTHWGGRGDASVGTKVLPLGKLKPLITNWENREGGCVCVGGEGESGKDRELQETVDFSRNLDLEGEIGERDR